MSKKTTQFAAWSVGIAACGVLAVIQPVSSQQAVAIDADDIGGVVTSAKGPEAGVWVVAETRDLPTRFARTVVTDDRGRYVIPDLPSATYDLFVRGYGLVDSPKVKATPGKVANLTAVAASTPREAAEYYPSNYWYSLLQVPARSEFPGTGPSGNGIAPAMTSQGAWIENVKTDSCTSCHQMGNKVTREIPEIFRKEFPSSAAAWDRRVRSGQDGAGLMNSYLARFGDRKRVLDLFADWTDRIAKGEYPQQAPPRPEGVERNVVITQWEWANPSEYFHDAISTDKRSPSVNANGNIYGGHENSSDHFSMLDPKANSPSQLTFPHLGEELASGFPPTLGAPSPYWGEEVIWVSRTVSHSNTMDQKGRVWNTNRNRLNTDQPAFCKEGSDHPSAKLYPIAQSGRQYTVYDPKTKAFNIVNTCFGTFHLNFAHDADNTIWSGQGGVVGWVNTKILDETGDQAKAQGWAPLIVDTNGNGRQDAWVEPNAPLDPAKDTRINMSYYGISPSPADGSIWGSITGFPGAIVRLDPGKNPPTTALAEVYYLPMAQGHPVQGYSPRGMDVDKNGVVWTVLASGHFASFDRRKCKGPLNGPKALEGQHCQEGWSFYAVPGPNFKGNPESASADSNYYNWVDKYNTLGLGENIPIATGNGSGSLLALKDGKWVVLRVPYPLGYFNKQIDGRIDNPNTGWKGKGLWTTTGNRVPWHNEGGKGNRPQVVRFQLRPTPLAK